MNDRAESDGLTRWLRRHIQPGQILFVGDAATAVPVDPDTHRVVHVEQLAPVLAYHGVFDHAWVACLELPDSDPADLLLRVFDAVKPGGTLLVTVPYGLSGRTAVYPASLRRLVEPLFAVAELTVVGADIAVVGTRRDEPIGAPVLSLTDDEDDFHRHERRLDGRLGELRAELVQSGARYRGAMIRLDKVQADLQRVTHELARLRDRIARFRWLYRIPLAAYRTLTAWRRPATPGPLAVTAELRGSPPPDGLPDAARPWRDSLRSGFQEWLAAARSAPGDEVVLMFSGTTFVQERRGNRPIRLTNVYLSRGCPVFFNYHRFNDRDPLPEHPDELLFQSPIDATAAFLDDLLTADFGGRKKTFYASFPHELMVRYLTLAPQHGWVTVYDVRDDWEEFAKVGMAKWYHPGYERYVATHSDIVTAVSRPLARKISALAGDRQVHVSANALDTAFPSPAAARTGRQVVGYFGHLTDKWFDWALVVAAAERYPEYTFELAGHQQPGKLDLPHNVRLLGLLGHREIAERSRSWSLAIIPFKIGPLADAVDPIKIYEYLHLRLPVLATYFPQCRDYPGTTITEGRDEFLDRLPEVMGADLDDAEVSEWLAGNTWERRVDTYTRLTDEVRQRGRRDVMALLEGRP